MRDVLLTIFTVALVTFLTRALPFLFFKGNRPTPAFVKYLGIALPPAIIGMLIVYCFKNTSFLSSPYGLPEIIAGLSVIGLHKRKHNMLLSIGGGTALYMILVQTVFRV